MHTYSDYLRQLRTNSKQWEAFTKSGHTVVIAGPGSGKTHVLSLKIAHLLREEITPPQGIACLTYTRVMAKELETRLWTLGISSERPNIVISTVHGFCLGHVVQPYAQLFELGLPLPVRIAPSSVVNSCFDRAWRECFDTDYDSNDRSHSGYRTDWIKYRRKNADTPHSIWQNDAFAKLYGLYRLFLFDEKCVDFDIIVEAALGLIIEQDLVRKSIYSRFAWLAVDEYQDLGYPLYKIVTELIDHTPIKLFAIGDPNQAIFDFAGTDPQYLYDLAEREDVQPVVTLDKNYRSTQEIIDVAEVILPPYSEYQAENVTERGMCHIHEYGPPWSANNQGQLVVQVLKEYQECGVPLERIAILHRWRKNGVDSLAERLEKDCIPFVLDKHPLYDRGMILIRWFEDLGYWCLRGWSSELKQRVCFEDLLNTWLEITVQKRQSDETTAARILLTRVLWDLKGKDLRVGDWLTVITDELDLGSRLTTYGISYPDEIEEFQKLLEVTQNSGELSNLRLSKFANTTSGVQLITLHSSKGMEFDVVVIAGVENIEKSCNGRRLLYVGATRARYEVNFLYNKWDWETRSAIMPSYIKELLQRCGEWSCFQDNRIG